MSETRIEKDSMGEMRVPADAYYGAQTGRAVENFPISDLRLPPHPIGPAPYARSAPRTADLRTEGNRAPGVSIRLAIRSSIAIITEATSVRLAPSGRCTCSICTAPMSGQFGRTVLQCLWGCNDFSAMIVVKENRS